MLQLPQTPSTQLLKLESDGLPLPLTNGLEHCEKLTMMGSSEKALAKSIKRRQRREWRPGQVPDGLNF